MLYIIIRKTKENNLITGNGFKYFLKVSHVIGIYDEITLAEKKVCELEQEEYEREDAGNGYSSYGEHSYEIAQISKNAIVPDEFKKCAIYEKEEIAYNGKVIGHLPNETIITN